MNQIKAILWKNLLINKRSMEYLRENISVIILGLLIVVVQRQDHNNFITPFYLAIAIFGYSRAVGLNWVTQKFNRHRQVQKIMGMKTSSYFIGWIAYFLLNGIFVCVIMLLILRFFAMTDQFVFVEGYTFMNIIILYILFMINITFFVLLLSSFFQNPKNAAQGIIFLQLLINMVSLIRISKDFSQNSTLTHLAGCLPQIAFIFGMSTLGFFPNNIAYTYEDAVFSLSVGAFVFMLLALYLDQVLPNQFGSNKKPLFFLDCFKSKNKNTMDQRTSLLLESDQIAHQGETSATYEQKVSTKKSPLIQMHNVVKKYGEKQVVSNVTMNYYSNQIFCLLGHNGAGKSTTINLLTGILKPQKGKISLMGQTFKQNDSQIRNNIGVCLQYNVLYDQLTVKEHLQFFCISKGIPKQTMASQIQSILHQCNIQTEKQKLSKNLSGGNKRKLSLANALIGKSKFIFLDEPSSGLDPNSRQSIWGILKAIRTPQRCILLTTHHLQQAQQLSQRIGIMSYGKLVIVGDCDFIKDTFNVGYHLTLNFEEQHDENQRVKAKKIIDSIVSNARQDQQTAINTIKYIIPQNQIEKFPQLFHQLQKICGISLKMSSLEDSFVKLGQNQMNQGVLEEIAEMQLPDAHCKYSFGKQFKAIILRKIMSSFRSLPGIVSIILPCLFIALGMTFSALLITTDDIQSKAIRLYLLSFFFVWTFIFNTSSFCGDLVLERQKKFKYLSHVMGLRKFPYWTANYIFDYFLFIIPFILFIILVFAFGEKASEVRQILNYIIPMLLLFGFSIISYSYMFSFMFQKSSTAFRLFPFFNLIFFYTLPSIVTTLDQDGFESIYILPLISPFIAMNNSFFTPQMNRFMPNNNYDIKFIYVAFIIQGVGYLLGTLAIQNLRFRLKDKSTLSQNQQIPQQANLTAQINDGDQVVVKNLYKKYSNGYMAINNNTFSVKKGQIFGLLGPNGAGKSTTFNIITAALSKTQGSVKILGQPVDSGLLDVFSQVGVCPQYDSIYENLTTQQHLIYFACLKGLTQVQIRNVLKYYYKILALQKYIHVRAGNLSGGNKRKLVVSMAMLGNPKIMFFDEPSSGVDPISRRYLWKSFSLSTRTLNSSMILTTHTMNEAQSLCSRIGILIKGSFVAVASLDNLKKKYGKGYRALLKAPVENHEAIKQIISNKFGKKSITFDQIGENKQVIIANIQSNKFKYSEAFKLFENQLKKKQLLINYKINESSLQQIFLLLSEMQPQPQQHSYKQPWQFCCWECGANGCVCLL